MILSSFLGGAVTFGFAVAALFFFRFWRDTGDELFLSFGLAFVLLSAVQAILALAGIPHEHRSWVYLIRLAAFVLILVGIGRKNRMEH